MRTGLDGNPPLSEAGSIILPVSRKTSLARSAVLRTGEGRDPLHPVCVTIDGSTYYKTRTAMFKSRVEQGLRDILGARGVFFDTVFVEDAPMIGSAVAGLIA